MSRILQAAVGADVPGATVTTIRPDDPVGEATPVAANLFLYQVSPNAAFRNADLPTRDFDGQLVERPQAALDLHYLLTFTGNDGQLEPQRILGSAARTLHARPVLTRADIRATIDAAVAVDPAHFLKNSDLDTQ